MKKIFVILTITLGMWLLAACGKQEVVNTPGISGTPEPFDTLAIQPTVVIHATDTPTPTATHTPTPTNTPTETPSPTPTLTVEEQVKVTDRRDENIPFIMIDPGHGGSKWPNKAPGACRVNSEGVEIEESDLNLVIAWKVVDRLMARGIQVIMTRNDDSYVNNYDRKALSDATDIDLFVSIHQNSSSLKSAKGAEVWRTTAFNKKSKTLASNVFSAITDIIGYSKYIIGDADENNAAKNLVVLQTVKPSILVECGYMTHDEEFVNLCTSDFQDKLADGIVNGIIAYYKELELYPDFDFGK